MGVFVSLIAALVVVSLYGIVITMLFMRSRRTRPEKKLPTECIENTTAGLEDYKHMYRNIVEDKH